MLYEVPDYLLSRETVTQGRKSLDAIEGEGRNYERLIIDVIKSNGAKISALTYVVKKPELGLKTSWEYVKYILTGLEERNMPAEYRDYVRSCIIANNAELEKQVQAFSIKP